MLSRKGTRQQRDRPAPCVLDRRLTRDSPGHLNRRSHRLLLKCDRSCWVCSQVRGRGPAVSKLLCHLFMLIFSAVQNSLSIKASSVYSRRLGNREGRPEPGGALLRFCSEDRSGPGRCCLPLRRPTKACAPGGGGGGELPGRGEWTWCTVVPRVSGEGGEEATTPFDLLKSAV